MPSSGLSWHTEASEFPGGYLPGNPLSCKKARLSQWLFFPFKVQDWRGTQLFLITNPSVWEMATDEWAAEFGLEKMPYLQSSCWAFAETGEWNFISAKSPKLREKTPFSLQNLFY